MSQSPTRWGICSTGFISSDFAACIFSLPDNEHVLQAVGASSIDRAREFASLYKIPQVHGSYEDLAKDPNVDVVYVGSINTTHFEQVAMMLNAGKHVICEKPMCLSVKDTKALTELAKKKNLFLMEAIWSRFFPSYQMAKKLISEGEIGDVIMVQASMGVKLTTDRVLKKELGGGAIYDLGIYPLQFAQFFMKDKPVELGAKGVLNDDGVDISNVMTIKYAGGRLADLACSTLTILPNEAIISGTKGFIKIHSPFWCPTKITVDSSTKVTSIGKVHDFSLPTVTHRVNFDNSQGLTYEAQEVRKCVLEGKIESNTVPHQNSIELSEILNELRKNIGHVRPEDES